jgi:hypothetical protein
MCGVTCRIATSSWAAEQGVELAVAVELPFDDSDPGVCVGVGVGGGPAGGEVIDMSDPDPVRVAATLHALGEHE